MASLEATEAEGGKLAHLASRFIHMKKDIAVPTSAILILNTVANTAGAAVAGMYSASLLGPESVPLFSLGLTFAILFLSEILPKTYGATHWKSLWPSIVWPLTVMQKALYPLIKVTQAFAKIFTGSGQLPAITEEEIVAMIRLGGKAGELSPAELQLLSAVFHFDEINCRQVMASRRDVDFFDASWQLPECVEFVRRTQHTRYPVCRGSMDEVLGLLHIKDLLGVSPDAPFDIQSIMRPLRSVPETLPISRLLREMQSTHQHMAVVVDEFGTAVGIITLENVLEQIVGAVQDEFDTEMPDIVPDGPNQFIVQGHLPIERINRELHLELSNPDIDTLSGLLVSKLGRLLRAGDQVRIEGATAEVVEVQAGRATRVRLKMSSDSDDDKSE
jgi:CBS domain containing-hemolysin-like protein